MRNKGTITLQMEWTITRVVPAPRDRVWRAWTNPDDLTHWLHPAGIESPRDLMTFDVKPGGQFKYAMVTPDGSQFPSWGEYFEVDEPTRLAFTWANPGMPDAPPANIWVDFSDHKKGGTNLDFTLSGIPGGAGDQNVYDGWSQSIRLLEVHLEEEAVGA
ncbi:MAG TPA: SRPBCC domain-containing protein [Terrimesophilobacter sp.]|nr:SRPBCC domain-containing protein [Terrimesophilobacter sp.]HRQ00473.1 SRPBCC domain-containing protein [Terrimesophilobacter sp.]